jgi:Tol biopolymer transport system component
LLVACNPEGDGKLIAYHHNDGHFFDGHIYIISDWNSEPKRLVRGFASEGCPSWSPDGERIIFAGSQENDLHYNDLYIVDSDGRNLTKLTDGDNRHYDVSWSSDGGTIVYTAADGRTPNLYMMNLSAGEETLLLHGFEFYNDPNWEPNGESIIFSSNLITYEYEGSKPPILNENFDIFRYVLDTGEVVRLTDSVEMEWVRNPIRDHAPKWSNAGDKIVYVSKRYLEKSQWNPDMVVFMDNLFVGDRETELETRLLIFNLETGARNEVLRVPGSIFSPAWSSDDSQLIFSSNMDNYEGAMAPYTESDLYILELESGEITRLTSNGGNYCPEWQP